MRDERPTVIIAEDEPLLRVLLEDSLEECGFEVLSASDGLEALELIKLHPECRLLLSDIRMPRMDGYALARSVLEIERQPIIWLLSGYSDPVPESLKHAVVVLRKPMSLNVICDRAKAALGLAPPASSH